MQEKLTRLIQLALACAFISTLLTLALAPTGASGAFRVGTFVVHFCLFYLYR